MASQQLSNRFKRALFPILALSAGCVLAVVLAEGLVRIFFPHARDHAITRNVLALDGELGWKLAPSTSATHATRFFTADYRINSLGFRDRPRAEEKSAGVHRVLVFGDSHVFGWGVALPERFTSIVEASKPGWEICNLAVPGYGLDQEILSCEMDGGRFRADELVFFVTKAILRRSRSSYIYAKYKPLFAPDGAGGVRLAFTPEGRVSWMSAIRAVLAPMALPYFLETRLSQVTARPGEEDWRPREERLSDLEKGLILRAGNIGSQRGQKVRLLLNIRQPFQDEVKTFAVQHGIDCTVIEIDIRQPGAIFSAEDPHWTPSTHAAVARQILAQWD